MSAPPGHDARASMLPTGTLTFLVVAAGGSWAQLDPVVDAALAATGGRRSEQGSDDKLVVAFESAADAVAAALDVRAVVRDRAELRAIARALRIALHTGDARVRDGGRYIGPAVRTIEQLTEIANGGQMLVSATTASALAGRLPAGASLADLGLHRLRDLSSPMRVFELEHGDEAAGRTPLRSLDRVPNNLPVHLTGFVGRQAELTAVASLLRGQPLVTLTGVGGAGKSRLAAQLAAGGTEQWPDGIWWVELAPVTDSADVAKEVAEAIGVLVEPVRGPLRSLTALPPLIELTGRQSLSS